MTVLADRDILELMRSHNLISPIDYESVNPASINLKLGAKIKVYGNQNIPTTKDKNNRIVSDQFFEYRIMRGESYTVRPGTFILASTEEFVCLPDNVSGLLVPRSSSSRKGLSITTGWVDPGYCGQLTYAMTSMLPVVITPGKSLVQLVLYDMETTPMNPYQGSYQYSSGPTEAYQQQPVPWNGEAAEDITPVTD